jgi:hypothetical protein
MAFSTREKRLPSSSSFPRSRLWPQVPRFAMWAAAALGIVQRGRSRGEQQKRSMAAGMNGKNLGRGFFLPRVRMHSCAAGVDDVEDWA